MNLQQQIAYIERKQEDARRFAAEQRALVAKDARMLWPFPVGGMVAGAAVFGAGMVFAKLIGA
ncbi:hypothetical protein RX330_15660 [Bradyrhizobium sp. NDS-1]|uniref:hypothetical protein n=1 Tax=Bradyrhizobium sp. NDS-1 TaxID=3080014 RepID=UPI00293EF9FC|nr:hypothetical protein [Bradyrhizobium sp. NDS-1]WOH76440.1 hypothetical protein RX330_15660 [Bradyrhizobium sp. NDS-1]